MQTSFHLERTLQAVATLLKASPARRMNYMRLLKLLYIAEREMLAEHALPLTGDQAVAMQRGPVLSQTYQLILGKSGDATVWAKHIHKDHYDVLMVSDPGRGQLSEAMMDKLHEVVKRYEDLDEWDMVEESHKFAEWRKNYVPGGKSIPIQWEDALLAQGKAHLIPEVESDERASRLFDQMLEG